MIVISDASPLISLAKIGYFENLRRQFRKIDIPEAVYNEVAIQGKGRAGSKELKQAPWINRRKIKDIQAESQLEQKFNLGSGESALVNDLREKGFHISDHLYREIEKIH